MSLFSKVEIWQLDAINYPIYNIIDNRRKKIEVSFEIESSQGCPNYMINFDRFCGK
jgi:hypothetical protein